jgi:hypothetical protein
MRNSLLLMAALALACASRPKIKEKPLVRVTPNGYELVSDNGNPKERKSPKVCQMEEIVGSHLPKLVCYAPEDADAERIGTQMQWDQEHGCQFNKKMCGGQKGN